MKKIIDLGMQPFADRFISEKQLTMHEPVYPLECYLNINNGEIKVGVETNKYDRYIAYEYSYTSSNSEFSRKHWIQYASDTEKKLKLPLKSTVVEIGSNDGFLTKQFMEMGHKVLGVDPSPYVKKLAEKIGVKTHCDFFSESVSGALKTNYGSANLIIANNVYNHADDIEDFTKGVANLLKNEGVFIIEVPYWYNTIKDGKYDQIYHEHITYFTVKYSDYLLRKHGLEIFDIQVVNYHGGSLRIYAKKKNNILIAEKVKSMIAEEEAFGLFNVKTYEVFMSKLKNNRAQLLKKICNLKLNSKSIIGIGAAAKGNTLLTFNKLDNTFIDYITDASPHKIGKYTPLTRIPIVGDEILTKYKEVYALILSWNITNQLKLKLKELNKNITFIECKPL